MTLARIHRSLAKTLAPLRFAPPVHHVYNPLEYARAPFEDYLRRYGAAPGRVVLLGMNPGPWGMAQTGVPFGDVAMVRDFLGVRGRVGKPADEHPKRPVTGFDCPRSEGSGSRLWGWARDRYGRAEDFFERFFVLNYCPLLFLEESGRNRTPDKLTASEREALTTACDDALKATIAALAPSRVVGVGVYAEKRARQVLGDAVPIGRVLHPSPASPAANRGWAPQAEAQLEAQGIRL